MLVLLVRSWFSLRKGVTPIPDLVARIASRGWKQAALADRGLYGAPSFVKACRDAGVRPLLAWEASSGEVFLAGGPEGYTSLCRLVTGYNLGGGRFPAGLGPGLVMLVSRPEQAAPNALLMLDYRSSIGVNQALARLGLPVVAVARGDEPPDYDQFRRAFAWCPPALLASEVLSADASDPWPAAQARLPRYEGDIRSLARAGLLERYGTSQAPYDQLEKELEIICQRGQDGYFLALWDLVRFARREGIPVGPGRGSAVGSLTAYALGITAVDPLAHRLYFERFLNPERPDLPDIDLDVCSRGRHRLIEYLRQRHGSERVAHAGILTTLGPRGAVREAGRRLGTAREVVDRVAGVLPHHGRIDQAVEQLPEFRYINPSREPVRSLLSTARELEGRPWHPSVHAAGVVIGPEPLADLVPLEMTAGGEVITQYSAEELEALGLAKIDILGLRNLTVIAVASSSIGLDPERLPAGDLKTFSLLAAGESLGVFQLDSPGIRNLLRQVKPESLEDLIAILSLYRPGPFEAGAVDSFTRRRRGLEPVRHIHPALAPILGETYGVLLYQEQAMRIAHEVAGLSLAEADRLRRDLGKGRASGWEGRFLSGCAGRGIAESSARKILGLLHRFSGYSFAKAHTAAYARISYQTAYLKAHYPAHYFAALLAHESGYFKPEIYIREAERLGVRLLPVHVNRSQGTYEVEGSDSIRTGLLTVRGAGPVAVEAILAARRAGPFRSVADFCTRVPRRHCRPQLIESLLDAGAFAGLPDASGAKRCPPATQPVRRQLTLFDPGLPSAPASQSSPSPIIASEWQGPDPNASPDGNRVQFAGSVITCRRRVAAGGQLGLTMLLQVGAEQVEVLVPPEVYARDLLAIDPKGIAVEGRILRKGLRVQVIAWAIRQAV